MGCAQREEGRFTVVPLPNVTHVFYGRDVGYAVVRIDVDAQLQTISGTEQRRLLADPCAWRGAGRPCRNLRAKSTDLKIVWIQYTTLCSWDCRKTWGPGSDRHWRAWIVGWVEPLSEGGPERAIADSAPNLQQQVGPAPRPAHLEVGSVRSCKGAQDLPHGGSSRPAIRRQAKACLTAGTPRSAAGGGAAARRPPPGAAAGRAARAPRCPRARRRRGPGARSRSRSRARHG